MSPKYVVTALTAIVLIPLGLLIAWRLALTAPSNVQTYQARGQVLAIDVSERSIRVSHDEIPNYMPAMTMNLSVHDRVLLQSVGIGDLVDFELSVSTDDSWISRLRGLGRPEEESASAAIAAEASPLSEAELEAIQPGERLPDLELLSEDGTLLRSGDLRGKAVVLTFIYTRCPLPNYCPLMSRNFTELERRLSQEFAGKFQLVSVTLDPAFDRPEVLKSYSSRYRQQRSNWTFATGTSEQIQRVAGLFGVQYAVEGGLISHDLRTALISPDGRLIRLWKSNYWTPYEVQRAVRKELTGSEDPKTADVRRT